MPASYYEVTEDVIKMADELIDLYHESLLDANIGIIFRDEAPTTNGRATLGKARKVTAEWKVHLDLDFVIWLAHDEWSCLTDHQRRALLDHELCHCQYYGVDMSAKIRPHDIEEFNAVLQRWGFWWPNSKPTELAIQGRLGIDQERTGMVVTMKSFQGIPLKDGDREVTVTADEASQAAAAVESIQSDIDDQ